MREWEDLKAMLASGKLSRRDFIKRSLALGVSAATAGTLLAGVAQAAEQPKRGGHLLLGLHGGSSSDSIDPATYTSSFMQVMGQQIFNPLLEVDVGADVRARPKLTAALAESWQGKPGAKEWVMKLRKDVTFSNGKTMTPEDVIYSINHHRGKDSKSGAKAYLTSVTDIKATGKDEVTITLDAGNADLPFILADFHLQIVPEGDKFDGKVTTGPYVVEDFEPGVRLILKRNPNHFRKDRGFVDSMEALAINDATARINALNSGSVHIINRVDPKSVLSLSRNPKLQLFEITAGAHYTFPMRCDTAPFNNIDVRLALKYAIDRQAIVDRVLLGHGKIGNDNPIASHYLYYASNIQQRPYDPDRAKHHMKRSGYSGPIVLSISDAAFTGAIDTAQIFQGSAAKAGIKLEIDRVPADGYWDNVWMKKPFCGSYWEGRATVDLMLSVAYTSDAAWNEAFWKRPDFDKLLAAARVELNSGKRMKMYHDLQAMVVDDCGELIPMFNSTIDAGSKQVKGFVPSPVYQMGGGLGPQKVWLDT
ncbi:MAG: twin-arginine translocation signal domain-containing protein [Gammaproteobacteria bacterium]|nr:twin-arginine translocation signal domain-containing protein [Gammaproteobacteria bacterium]